MEIYVVVSTEGLYYESEGSEIVGVYSSLEEAKRQANRYLSINDKDEEVSQFDMNDDDFIMEYNPYLADYGYISIVKCVLDEELDIEED